MVNAETAMRLSQILSRDDIVKFRAFLADVMKDEGVTRVSRATKIPRQTLYDMLSERGNPSFTSVHAVLRACGLMLLVVPADSKGAPIVASPRALYSVKYSRRKK